MEGKFGCFRTASPGVNSHGSLEFFGKLAGEVLEVVYHVSYLSQLNLT